MESSQEAPRKETIELLQPSSSAQPATKITDQSAGSSRKWSVSSSSEQENDSSNSVRYDLSSLLPKLRFLLPLCNQRWRLVQELLHTTELSAPDYMPVITVDRRVPLIERHAESRNSVFLQIYHELRGEKLHFRSVSLGFCLFRGYRDQNNNGVNCFGAYQNSRKPQIGGKGQTIILQKKIRSRGAMGKKSTSKYFLHKPLPTQKKIMNNLKVRKTFHAPENCPLPPYPLLQGPLVSAGHYTRENVGQMPSAAKQVACVKRETCFSKSPSLKLRVPALVL